MGNWDDDVTLGNSFDNPEACECSLAFHRDECGACGHDLACIDAYCKEEAHIQRLSRSCDCQTALEVEECEDCYHDLSCSISDCDNDNHDKANTYGNPKLCGCRRNRQVAKCSNCGHTIACLKPECSECDEPDHMHRICYFTYPEHCECSDFHEPISCDSCKHDLNCPENGGYCIIHFRTDSRSPAETQSRVEGQGGETPQVSSVGPGDHRVSKAGAYWTRAEDETLAGSYLGGASDGQISELLGRSVSAIRLRLIKVCFEANGIQINQDLSRSQESQIEWVESEDSLLKGLIRKNVELPLISQALNRSELSVAFRLVAKRIARPGDLNLIVYRTPKSKNSMGQGSRWTNAQYVELREHFRNGESIEDLAAKLSRSELSCFAVLYARGEITNAELNLALKTAVGTLDYLKKI